ncbi:unnamed protein product [Acanthoscelides obtectus]|nr:unnamed protein product [Acanthoscelides obtectus]CAK1638211.1 Cytosolic beta-glucosidase [Acanthoscelides obtectus]
MIKTLGVDYYRFSLSWPRILPYGTTDYVNQKGVEYYRNLIKNLKKNNIEPMVTLFHWDLPQTLQDRGGFLNEKIVEWFRDYARLCFQLFGDDVKTWITFNEPKQTCMMGYGLAIFPPRVSGHGILEYKCTYYLLKAHAESWHVYNEEFRQRQKGRISIVVDFSWWEPMVANNTMFIAAAESGIQFMSGIYANAIYLGDWPEIVKQRVNERSRKEGKTVSRLPAFTEEEIARIRGTYDFFGVNFYTSVLAVPNPIPLPSGILNDRGCLSFQSPKWEGAGSIWLKVTPWGLKKLLKYLKETYNNPEIIITENGYSDTGELEDDKRISYIKQHLEVILEAREEFGVNVTAYTAWSLMDNFEWIIGYRDRFGLYHVDFTDPERKRTIKKSALYYRDVIKSRCVDGKCE